MKRRFEVLGLVFMAWLGLANIVQGGTSALLGLGVLALATRAALQWRARGSADHPDSPETVPASQTQPSPVEQPPQPTSPKTGWGLPDGMTWEMFWALWWRNFTAFLRTGRIEKLTDRSPASEPIPPLRIPNLKWKPPGGNGRPKPAWFAVGAVVVALALFAGCQGSVGGGGGSAAYSRGYRDGQDYEQMGYSQGVCGSAPAILRSDREKVDWSDGCYAGWSDSYNR